MHIAHLSTFSPTPCGIATFTESLIDHLDSSVHSKLRMQYHCDEELAGTLFNIRVEDPLAYAASAARVNDSSIDVVSLQHEFAIFGGRDGEYLLKFIAELRKPLVTTLHTTPAVLTDD